MRDRSEPLPEALTEQLVPSQVGEIPRQFTDVASLRMKESLSPGRKETGEGFRHLP